MLPQYVMCVGSRCTDDSRAGMSERGSPLYALVIYIEGKFGVFSLGQKLTLIRLVYPRRGNQVKGELMRCSVRVTL